MIQSKKNEKKQLEETKKKENESQMLSEILATYKLIQDM